MFLVLLVLIAVLGGFVLFVLGLDSYPWPHRGDARRFWYRAVGSILVVEGLVAFLGWIASLGGSEPAASSVLLAVGVAAVAPVAWGFWPGWQKLHGAVS